MDEYVNAWRSWFAGSEIAHQSLWFMKIYWWGRLGLAFELIGGLTILGEIITFAKIRKFARSMPARVNLLGVRRIASAFLGIAKRFFQIITSKRGSPKARVAMADLGPNGIVAIMVSIAATTFLIGRLIVWSFGGSAFVPWISYSLGFIASWAVSPILILAIGSILVAIVRIVSVPISAISFLLDRESLKIRVYTAALFMVILGFHFDLLSS